MGLLVPAPIRPRRHLRAAGWVRASLGSGQVDARCATQSSETWSLELHIGYLHAGRGDRGGLVGYPENMVPLTARAAE